VNRADQIALVGAVVIFAMSGLFALTALHVPQFRRYGREALLCAAAWTFIVALMRVFSLAGKVSTDTVRSTNTVAAVVAVVILTEIAWVRRAEQKNGEKPAATPPRPYR